MNGALDFHPASLDLGFQQRDTFAQLLHRERIEVLPGKLHQQIIFATRKIFVGVHMPKR